MHASTVLVILLACAFGAPVAIVHLENEVSTCLNPNLVAARDFPEIATARVEGCTNCPETQDGPTLAPPAVHRHQPRDLSNPGASEITVLPGQSCTTCERAQDEPAPAPSNRPSARGLLSINWPDISSVDIGDITIPGVSCKPCEVAHEAIREAVIGPVVDSMAAEVACMAIAAGVTYETGLVEMGALTHQVCMIEAVQERRKREAKAKVKRLRNRIGSEFGRIEP